MLASGEREGQPLVWYYYAPTRSQTVVTKLFSEYTGILHSDAYSAYNAADKCIHQCCMTHCRRRFVDCARGGKADVVLEYMKKLYDVEGKLKEQKATAEQILKERQEISKPVFEEMFKYIESIFPKEGSKLADAVGYALNYKNELATYLYHPQAIDNNRAERAIRPFTIA